MHADWNVVALTSPLFLLGSVTGMAAGLVQNAARKGSVTSGSAA